MAQTLQEIRREQSLKLILAMQEAERKQKIQNICANWDTKYPKMKK